MNDNYFDYTQLKSTTLSRELNIDEIYTLFDHTLTNHYSSKGESHGFWEYVYVNKGTLYVETLDTVTEVNEGQILLHQPNDYHRHFVIDRSANIIITSFGCNHHALEGISGIPITINPLVRNLVMDTLPLAHRIFVRFEMYEGLTKKADCTPLNEQLLRNSIESVLICLIDEMTHNKLFFEAGSIRNNHKSVHINEVIDFMKTRVCDSITIEELCSEFHVGKTTLSTTFKDSTSMSVMSYFNHLKIMQSMALLTQKEMNISEVALKLNFSSSQYFSKTFKKYTGVTPREFMKRYAESAEGLKRTLS